jgi:hypothetical protein
MKFMLMMNAPRGTGDWAVVKWPPERLRAHIDFMHAFNAELRSEGKLVEAAGLAPPGAARVVRAGHDGRPEITDGPFAETKEFLAGYWIVQVDSAEQAYALAAKASTAPGPDGTPLQLAIEVREVLGAPTTDPC